MPERRRAAGLSLSSAWAELRTILSLFKIPQYLKMLLYVFLAAFSFDLTTAMVYWYGPADGGAAGVVPGAGAPPQECQGGHRPFDEEKTDRLTSPRAPRYEDVPQFSKQFMGFIGTAGWLVALLAVVVNATFFKGVSFRKLYAPARAAPDGRGVAQPSARRA